MQYFNGYFPGTEQPSNLEAITTVHACLSHKWNNRDMIAVQKFITGHVTLTTPFRGDLYVCVYVSVIHGLRLHIGTYTYLHITNLYVHGTQQPHICGLAA